MALGSAALLASGCVPMERELRIDQDLSGLKGRVEAIEQGLAAQGAQSRAREEAERQRGEQLDGMARRQADLQAGQEALRVELQALRGLADDATARRREEQDALALAQKDAALRLGGLDGRLGAFESRLTRMEKELAEVRAAQQAKAAEPPPAAVAPEALYEQGRELIQNKGDAARGRTILEEFVKARPQSELLPNALYWIGEAYYSEKRFENAIVQFQDVIEKYPAHPKAAAALYKQALAFESLGEPKKSAALLRKLVETYPLADEAKRARERLAEKPKP